MVRKASIVIHMQPRKVFIVSIVLSAVVLLSLSQTASQCNPSSRFATIESLVHRGTFIIDDSRFSDTSDKVMIEGHSYSSKPPMLSVLSSGAYFIFSKVTGITFDTDEQTSIRFISLLVGGLPYLLLLYFFYRLLLLWTDSDRTVALGLLVFTFNFIGLGYAASLNNHTPAAVCLFISFYFAFRIRNSCDDRSIHWLLSGFLAGLAATFEFWSGFFCISFALYLASKDLRRTLILFLPAVFLPVAGHFILTLIITGSLLPIYLRPDLYQFAGAYWQNPVGIDALHEPKYIYFFHIILGHHGFLSMTPVFFLAGWSIWTSISHKTCRYAEALVIGVPLTVTVLFLGIKTRNYGGICAGLRWMIVVMPLLFLFVTEWIDRHRSGRALILLAILTMIGLAVMVDIPWANAGPWHHSGWHKYIFGLY